MQHRIFLSFKALKTEDGSYILNGNRRLHPTGSYFGAGTEFEYHRRKHNRCPGECIQAKGPTNTAVIVEVWSRDEIRHNSKFPDEA